MRMRIWAFVVVAVVVAALLACSKKAADSLPPVPASPGFCGELRKHQSRQSATGPSCESENDR